MNGVVRAGTQVHTSWADRFSVMRGTFAERPKTFSPRSSLNISLLNTLPLARQSRSSRCCQCHTCARSFRAQLSVAVARVGRSRWSFDTVSDGRFAEHISKSNKSKRQQVSVVYRERKSRRESKRKSRRERVDVVEVEVKCLRTVCGTTASVSVTDVS